MSKARTLNEIFILLCCRFACVIGLQDSFLMTGGVGTEYQVSLYNEDGFLNYLPMMNQGRYDHGCGHYINKELELVETQTKQYGY